MTTTTLHDEPDVPVAQALATSVMSLDAARRVGWAKAFAALDKVDGLSKEVNLRDYEIRALRRAYSRLLGLVTHLAGFPKSAILDEEISAHMTAERQSRHDDAWDAGIAIAAAHNDFVNGRAATKAERARVFEQARAVGHDIKTINRNGVVCTCGASFGPSERAACSAWSRKHAAQAVEGDVA